jgi:MazG family protein
MQEKQEQTNNKNITEEQQELQKLKSILTDLRNPETGCPWDKVQTISSIAPNTVEEAYEVQEAAETGNYESLREEVGDLLLHVLFYSMMAEEQHFFTLKDVMTHLNNKLISRHPHVFGDVKANNAEEALSSWENVKSKERENAHKKALDGIAVTLPPPDIAIKMQKRLARLAPDVKETKEQALEKLHNMLSLLNENPDEITAGQTYFAFINLLRVMKINPDTALRKYNRKFKQDFDKQT